MIENAAQTVKREKFMVGYSENVGENERELEERKNENYEK